MLANAKNTNDKIRVSYIHIQANIAQERFDVAVNNSLAILEELGVEFSTTDEMTMKAELAKTQSLLETRAGGGASLLQSILSKSTSSDSRHIGLMRILCCASRAAYVAKPPLMLFIVLRTVQMVIGDSVITAESSHAFANLSFVMSGLGNHSIARDSAKIALALLERFDQKYSNTVICLLNMSSLPYHQPVQACIEALRQGYKGAAAVGDRDWARISINQISHMSIMAPERGRTLDDVEESIRLVLAGFSSQEEGPKNLLVLSVLYLQLVLNLKGEANSVVGTEDPTVITGSAMNQEEYLRMCEEKGVRDYFRRFYCCRFYLAYLFHQHRLAEEMVGKCNELSRLARFCPSFQVITETFYMGLVAAAALQRLNRADSTSEISRWQQLANNSLTLLTKWADEGSDWNFLHKADLLHAEIAVATGDSDTALLSYQSAIIGAKKSGFVNEEALSCERAGLYLAQQGEIEEGRIYLRRAEMLYNMWGAHRKGQDVSSLIREHCS